MMKLKKTKKTFQSVMLIDDNEIDNFINERMIKGCCFAEKIYVNSGSRSALEFLKNIATNKLSSELFPDVIFLDINMPLMDGFMFIEEFEKIKLTNKDTKIIMLTSSISPFDEEKSKKYKAINQFVRKPLTEETLINILAQQNN